jgi:hypothetical protein
MDATDDDREDERSEIMDPGLVGELDDSGEVDTLAMLD